jgi:hypothetical protein
MDFFNSHACLRREQDWVKAALRATMFEASPKEAQKAQSRWHNTRVDASFGVGGIVGSVMLLLDANGGP